MVFRRIFHSAEPEPPTIRSPWHTGTPPTYGEVPDQRERAPLLWTPPPPSAALSGRRARGQSFVERIMSPYRLPHTRHISPTRELVPSLSEDNPEARRSTSSSLGARTARYQSQSTPGVESSPAPAIRYGGPDTNYHDPLRPLASRMATQASSNCSEQRSEQCTPRSSASPSSNQASTLTTASPSSSHTAQGKRAPGARRMTSPSAAILRKVEHLTAPCVMCGEQTWQCANARNITGFITIPTISVQVEKKDRTRLQRHIESTIQASEGNHDRGQPIHMYLLPKSGSRENKVNLKVSLVTYGHRAVPVVHVCDWKMEEISRHLRDEVNAAYVNKGPTRVCLVDGLENISVGAFLILED
ncbi:hypothetical protein P154DRAFT_540560 [Amniculicola lignicola CBS 123094]|uniref:Uncharacterized protein n=1 Tax=Amniculicola lignicola CBS 123094 TaxID=1392246 RepID=A0A6A5W6K2_9PLEO|nr:hypothetical protein P154DRAFT_540560 [Amniculicola lignicola CBS 123094]